MPILNATMTVLALDGRAIGPLRQAVAILDRVYEVSPELSSELEDAVALICEAVRHTKAVNSPPSYYEARDGQNN